MLKNGLLACAVAGALGTAGISLAGPDNPDTGPFGFTPIADSAAGDGSDFVPTGPWLVPPGFTQSIVSDESDLDIYKEPTSGGNSNDWHDMNTVNETGEHAGCYLYRTHEVRGNTERGGTVSVVDEFRGRTGFDGPDNLAQTPDGKLIIIEDNVPSDIWIADKDRDKDGVADNVWLFASLTDPGAEGTGIYFGKDPKTMFVNVQHSVVDDGDATWAITRQD